MALAWNAFAGASGSGTLYAAKEYYLLKAQELDAQIEALQAQLRNTDAETLLTQFTTQSMIYFRNALAERYGKSKTRPIFTLDTLWRTPVTFCRNTWLFWGLRYTARSSLSGTAQFDYVIMDEASQINIPTGFLALSSAQNAVVVGDTRQLSHIVTREERAALTAIAQRYPVPPAYDCIRYNFLRSLRRVMGIAYRKPFCASIIAATRKSSAFAISSSIAASSLS